MEDMTDHLKTSPSSIFMLPCWTWLFCVEWCRHKYRRELKKLGSAGTPTLLGWEVLLTQRYIPFPQICYLAERGHSCIKRCTHK